MHDVLSAFPLDGPAVVMGTLDGTHAAFQVQAGERLYALRQFNSYTTAEALAEQFCLARLLREAGLNVSVPISAGDGRPFAEVAGRLWALFPWCGGRPGESGRMDDLRALAAVQGRWVACAERLRAHASRQGIVRAASAFRQRKSWAWVVPLDRVPQFAREHRVTERAREEVPAGPLRRAFLDLLPEVDSGAEALDRLLRESCVGSLPHTVTHGDFWATNVHLTEDGPVVLDLDCFSFEPRVNDFARAAHWFHADRTPEQNASLLEEFQARARLTREELEALPLMMCARDMYYAVGHVALFVEEEDSGKRERLLAVIEHEMRAPERFASEGERMMTMFLEAR